MNRKQRRALGLSGQNKVEVSLTRFFRNEEEMAGKDGFKKIQSLSQKAYAAMSSCDLLTAEKITNELLEFKISLFGNEHPTVAYTLNDLSTILASLNRFQESEVVLKNAESVLSNLNFEYYSHEYRYQLTNLSRIYELTGRFEECIECCYRLLMLDPEVKYASIDSHRSLLHNDYIMIGDYKYKINATSKHFKFETDWPSWEESEKEALNMIMRFEIYNDYRFADNHSGFKNNVRNFKDNLLSRFNLVKDEDDHAHSKRKLHILNLIHAHIDSNKNDPCYIPMLFINRAQELKGDGGILLLKKSLQLINCKNKATDRQKYGMELVSNILLAEFLFVKKNYFEVIAVLEKYISGGCVDKISDPIMVRSMIYLAFSYSYTNTWSKAVKLFTSLYDYSKGRFLLTNCNKLDSQEIICDYVQSIINLTTVPSVREDIVDRLREALNILNNVKLNAQLYNLKADTYFNLSNYADNTEEKINLLTESLRLDEKYRGAHSPSVALTLLPLSKLCHPEKALPLLNRALKINIDIYGHDDVEVAYVYEELAVWCCKKNDYDEAVNNFKKAMTIFALHKESQGCEYSYSRFLSQHNLNGAIFYGKIHINKIQSARKDIIKIDERVLDDFDKSVADTYSHLASLLIKAGRYGEAEFVNGMQKDKEYFELTRSNLDRKLPNRNIAFNSAELSAKETLDGFATTLSTLGKRLSELQMNKIRTKAENLEFDKIKDNIRQVNRDFSGFLDNLHEVLPQHEVTQLDQNTYKLINMSDAGVDTVAVYVVTAEDNFHTVMVTPHVRKAFSVDYKSVDIATKVLKFRELLKEPENSAYLPLAKELYDIIIRPMEFEFLSGEYTTILWMLNGSLRLLPLAALHDGEQFLLNKFRNVCITTCSTIGQQRHARWNGLGMGVSQEHHGHSALLAVKEELEGIFSDGNSSGIIPGVILLDEAFTRDAMELNLDGGYKAVHIASHFELNPTNETMSYLLLGDGSKISLDELRSIPRLFKGVDIVAFSACSTGLGTTSIGGREVDGIGYLGEMQGAKTVMATLWPVEDRSTSMLMREFYRLREEGMTKAEAMQQAQLCLLNGKITSDDGYDFKHPYFWAPFILIGNGG